MIRTTSGVITALVVVTGCATPLTAEEARKYQTVDHFIRSRIVLVPSKWCTAPSGPDRHRTCDVYVAVSPSNNPEVEAREFVQVRNRLKLYCEAHEGTFSDRSSPVVGGGGDFGKVLLAASQRNAFGDKQCQKFGATVWNAKISFTRYVSKGITGDAWMSIAYSTPGQ